MEVYASDKMARVSLWLPVICGGYSKRTPEALALGCRAGAPSVYTEFKVPRAKRGALASARFCGYARKSAGERSDPASHSRRLYRLF